MKYKVPEGMLEAGLRGGGLSTCAPYLRDALTEVVGWLDGELPLPSINDPEYMGKEWSNGWYCALKAVRRMFAAPVASADQDAPIHHPLLTTAEQRSYLNDRINTACMGGDVDSKIVASLLSDFQSLQGKAQDASLLAAEVRELEDQCEAEMNLLRWNEQKAERIKALEHDLAEARKRCEDAEAANERDRTQLHRIVHAIDEEITGRMWLIEGRGSYEWDDDTYRKEFGWAVHALQEKLEPLRKITGDLTNCPQTEAGKQKALQQLAVAGLTIRCKSCGGTQIYKREGKEIIVFHDCCTSEHVRKMLATAKVEGMHRNSIYCDCCMSIQPLRTDEMSGDSADGCHTDTCDLICSTCSSVVATLFNRKDSK